MRRMVMMGAAGLLVAAIAGPAMAGGVEADLLAKDPGKAAAYSCFSRTYDAEHLAGHPKQNVTNMSVFVESTYDADADSKRSNYLEVGVKFRGLDKPYEMTGSCDTTVDGKKALSCGGDCGGGSSFSVSTEGPNRIVLKLDEDGGDLFDPAVDNSPDADPPDLPKTAAFGSDDRTFRLDRVDVKQCQSLMSDDAKAALLGTAEAAQ